MRSPCCNAEPKGRCPFGHYICGNCSKQYTKNRLMNGVHVVVDPDMQNDEWKLVQGQFHGRPSRSEYEIFKTIENMEAHGGSFVKQLAELARHADPINLKKIQNTWPEYWEKYSRDF